MDEYRPPETPVDPVLPRRRHPLAPQHYVWVVGAAIVLVLALHWLGPVLTPFLIGAIFAYLGSPVVDRLEKRRVPRSLSTLGVILLIGLLLAALFLVLIPLVQSEVVSITRRVPDLFAQFTERVAPILEEKLGVTLSFDFESIRNFITENAQQARDLSARLLSGVKAGGQIVLAVIINLALIPVVMFYLLRDWNMIIARIDDLLPRRWLSITRSACRSWDSTMRSRSGFSPACWCSFRTWASDSDSCWARWPRCSNGTGGRAFWR